MAPMMPNADVAVRTQVLWQCWCYPPKELVSVVPLLWLLPGAEERGVCGCCSVLKSVESAFVQVAPCAPSSTVPILACLQVRLQLVHNVLGCKDLSC